MSKLKIKGLGGASPALAGFVHKQADEITKVLSGYLDDSLEVVFFINQKRVEPNYTGKKLQFYTCFENELLDYPSKDNPFVDIYLVFLKEEIEKPDNEVSHYYVTIPVESYNAYTEEKLHKSGIGVDKSNTDKIHVPNSKKH